MRPGELIERPRNVASDGLGGRRRALKAAAAAINAVYRTGRGVGRWSERLPRLTAKPPSVATAGAAFAGGAAAGVGAAYLFDPRNGKRRPTSRATDSRRSAAAGRARPSGSLGTR